MNTRTGKHQLWSIRSVHHDRSRIIKWKKCTVYRIPSLLSTLQAHGAAVCGTNSFGIFSRWDALIMQGFPPRFQVTWSEFDSVFFEETYPGYTGSEWSKLKQDFKGMYIIIWVIFFTFDCLLFIRVDLFSRFFMCRHHNFVTSPLKSQRIHTSFMNPAPRHDANLSVPERRTSEIELHMQKVC